MNSEPIKVLDHGHVKLVDSMGNDAAIVAAARNSVSGLGVTLKSDDQGLIRFLMRHHHSTPFEAVVMTFEMKLPIFVARQLVRHRTQSLNEMSARYSELPEEYYVPKLEHIQHQADKNKQGRKDLVMDNAENWQLSFKNDAAEDFMTYKARLNDGMARELARITLPLSTYTQWWSTMNLHNCFHLLGLRKDSHAQFETRVFADAMGELVKKVCPIAYEAFEDFRLNAMSFSAQELEVLKRIIKFGGVIQRPASTADFKTKREASEFEAKLDRLMA